MDEGGLEPEPPQTSLSVCLAVLLKREHQCLYQSVSGQKGPKAATQRVGFSACLTMENKRTGDMPAKVS